MPECAKHCFCRSTTVVLDAFGHTSKRVRYCCWCGQEKQSAPVTTTVVRNGVKVKTTRSEGGSTVEADCQCFGSPGRVHSAMNCPNRAVA